MSRKSCPNVQLHIAEPEGSPTRYFVGAEVGDVW